jgi:hypothetical protein
MDVEQKEGEDVEKIPRAAGTPPPARQNSNGTPLERKSTQVTSCVLSATARR